MLTLPPAGLPAEDELFPIVHKNLYVVRFPAEAIHAKLACAASLAALHPPWLQEWQQLAQHRTLRVLQVGHDGYSTLVPRHVWPLVWPSCSQTLTSFINPYKFIYSMHQQHSSGVEQPEKWLLHQQEGVICISICSPPAIGCCFCTPHVPGMLCRLAGAAIGGWFTCCTRVSSTAVASSQPFQTLMQFFWPSFLASQAG